jgi:hypothetical protein
MIKTVDILFGNTLEIRILTTIIPLGEGTKLNVRMLMNATGASEKEVTRCLKNFESSGFLLKLKETNHSKGQKAPDWPFWVLQRSNRYVALYKLIHAAYDDELKKNAFDAISGNKKGEKEQRI